jgi:hypothetical protein
MREHTESMKLIRLGTAGLVVLCLSLALAAPVAADNDGKVFVCKYVSTPGEGEVLQEGGNPISVSVNAIPIFDKDTMTAEDLVGQSFNDQQGRSYVLAVDVGQEEPSRDECPLTTTEPTPTPTPTPTPEATPTPTPEDSVAGETATNTLPPTDTLGGPSTPGGTSWAVLLVVLTGIVATAYVITPHRSNRPR